MATPARARSASTSAWAPSTTIASIQVRWPSGTVQTVNAPIDKITTVQESAASGSR